MEEFRLLIVDSTVIGASNTGVLYDGDFVLRRDACSLESSGRKKCLCAYERPMDQVVTNPTFDYRVSPRPKSPVVRNSA